MGDTFYFGFDGKSSYAEFAGAPGADLAIGAPAIRTVSQDVTGTVTRNKTAVSDVWCPRGHSRGWRNSPSRSCSPRDVQ